MFHLILREFSDFFIRNAIRKSIIRFDDVYNISHKRITNHPQTNLPTLKYIPAATSSQFSSKYILNGCQRIYLLLHSFTI